jgi:Molybdopterin oxidoreductase N-terminal domain
MGAVTKTSLSHWGAFEAIVENGRLVAAWPLFITSTASSALGQACAALSALVRIELYQSREDKQEEY